MLDRRTFLAFASAGAATGLTPAPLLAAPLGELTDRLARELRIQMALAQALLARIFISDSRDLRLIALAEDRSSSNLRPRHVSERARPDCGVLLFTQDDRRTFQFSVSDWSLGPIHVRGTKASNGSAFLFQRESTFTAARALRITA